jgi:hypothetical protein
LKEIFDKLKKFGKIKHFHSHFSGIEYTKKGEKRHIVTPEFKLKELLEYIKKYKLSITIINESPTPLNDSIRSLEIWRKI